MKKLFTCLLLILPSTLFAEILEEVVVTGSYMTESPPAQRILKKADYLLLRVLITNDSREEADRKREIHSTLLAATRAAERDPTIELSSVTANDFVLPLTASNYQIDLNSGGRPDTNEAYFRVKAAITEQDNDGEQLILNLKRFVSELKMEGRTLVEPDGDVQVSIVNPHQYRNQAITMMADDVKTVTNALGDDYRVVLTGIDRPIKWAAVGSVDVAIYLPYEYIVVPTSISSITPMGY